jgi:hypothetical protein
MTGEQLKFWCIPLVDFVCSLTPIGCWDCNIRGDWHAERQGYAVRFEEFGVDQGPQAFEGSLTLVVVA